MILGSVLGIAIVSAFATTRLSIAYVLVGNPTALAAQRIEMVLDAYKVQQGHYPPPEFNLDELALKPDESHPKFAYLSALPRDAWGHSFRYKLSEGKPKIYSAGPDGVFDTPDDIYAKGLRCERRYVFK